MRDLVNVKTYDDYINNVLNEDLIREQNTCNRAFINGGLITFEDGSSVKPQEIIDVVENALMDINNQYPRTFEFAQKTLNIIFLAHSSKYKTMAVDKYMNLYLNAGFVYHVLKMDKELVGAVIMHEVFHALFNHIERGTNWLAAQGKTKTPQTWHDTNLAADVEVNQTLVKIKMIDKERLENEIHGIYLNPETGGSVIPLEIILNNEEYMNMLRKICPPPQNPENQPETKIQTTDEWNKGYKDAWNKIAGLIKKYGCKGTWEKLLDAGLVNGVGEIYVNKEIEDIMGLELLTVKSMEDYVNENLNVPKKDMGKTYDDGFMNAFGKLVNKLYNVNNPQPDDDDNDGPEPPKGGPKLKSDMDDNELDPIEFPEQKKKKKKGGNGDDVPENIISDGENEGEDDGEDSENKSKGAGKGSKGKSDDEITDDDINKLADDINKRTNGGNDKISTEQEIEYGGIGGTGSFQEEGLSDDDLREAGYSDDDIKSINGVREDNKINNSKDALKKKIDDVKTKCKNGKTPIDRILAKAFSAIEIEENKYKNVWKGILDDFLSRKTRRAGREIPNGSNDWINKKSISRGEYGIHRKKTSLDPQDINIYVDVSGSMDKELLEIISKSLVVLAKQWKYSKINVCPWANKNNGIHKIEDFYKKSEDVIVKEILDTISQGYAQCGGGTEIDAAIDVMVDCVVETLNDQEKKKKDDVHVIITDGQFNFNNVENNITNALKSNIDRDDVAENAPKNTVWMIYDAGESLRNEWNSEIKKGKIIFINSKVVKNNG